MADYDEVEKRCRHCGNHDHYSSECTKKQEQRRVVDTTDDWMKVHLSQDGSPLCNASAGGSVRLTIDERDVTCLNCKKTLKRQLKETEVSYMDDVRLSKAQKTVIKALRRHINPKTRMHIHGNRYSIQFRLPSGDIGEVNAIITHTRIIPNDPDSLFNVQVPVDK